MASETFSIDPDEIAIEIAHTPVGDIEYAVVGSGPDVMSIHGGMGDCRQGILLGQFLLAGGFRIIAPTRPIYGQSRTHGEPTLEAVAASLAALAEHLGVRRYAAITYSAGGATLYQLALQHPPALACIVAIDAVSGYYTFPEDIGPVQEKILNSAPGMALIKVFTKLFPDTSIKMLLKMEGSFTKRELKERLQLVVKDPKRRDLLLEMFHLMSEWKENKDGLENEMATLEALDESLPLDQIRVPAFIVHGTADNDVPFTHGDRAARAIPGAKSIWIDRGSHFGFLLAPEAEAVQQEVLAFLHQHLG